MASSANTSKTMHISLERKCTDLESQLSAKQKSLDFAEEKLKDLEENMALVIYEKEKQSSKLISGMPMKILRLNFGALRRS